MKSSPGFFLSAFSRFWSWLPRPFVRWLGSLLGILWFDIFRIRREVVLNNVAIAFPASDPAWRVRIARRSLRLFTANFSEFFTLPFFDARRQEKYISVTGWENVERARALGKGNFLLSLHMGAYDIACSTPAMRGQETYLISKFFKSRWLNNLWFSLRGAQGVKFIEPHGERTAFDILKALKKNASVIFVLDQFMGKPYGIKTKFFGRDTGTAYGLALFVLKTRSPVIPVYSFHDKDAKIHLVFEPAVPVENFIVPDDKDESIRRLTQAFNDRLEQMVRLHPDEWMWLHRRWKEFE